MAPPPLVTAASTKMSVAATTSIAETPAAEIGALTSTSSAVVTEIAPLVVVLMPLTPLFVVSSNVRSVKAPVALTKTPPVAVLAAKSVSSAVITTSI